MTIKTLPNGDTEGFSMHITSTVPEQPSALALADALEIPTVHAGAIRHEAASELRRLRQSEREGWRYADELDQQRKADEALLQQALEYLERSADNYPVGHGLSRTYHEQTIAAIKSRLS